MESMIEEGGANTMQTNGEQRGRGPDLSPKQPKAIQWLDNLLVALGIVAAILIVVLATVYLCMPSQAFNQ
jgi:heme/copper-type cytochrome/quinol oxidase subunit 2